MVRRILPLLLLAIVAATAPLPAAADPVPRGPAPAHGSRAPRFAAGTVLVQASAEVLRDHGLSPGRRIGATGFVVVDTGDEPAEAVRDRLRADPRVAAAELDYVRRAFATPNDPRYDTVPMQRVRLPAAWDSVKASSSQIIAVLDTGVDLTHPDLDGVLEDGRNVILGNGTPQDQNGHGTTVASIAAAETNNGQGVAGTSWGARIMPVQVLNASGEGFDSDVAEGITWAVDHGATIVNLSLGGEGTTAVLTNAVAYAASHNVVVVAAAGNDGNNVVQYPAAYDSVLAVGATDDNGSLAYFSQHGPWVDIVAPGTSLQGAASGGGYTSTATGTSFASPITAGVAALVRTKNPTWTAAQVVDRLQRTAQDIGPTGVDDSYGYGVLDASAALGGTAASAVAPQGGDAHEPNPVPAAAKLITTSATATVSPEGDVDWFAVDVAGPGSIAVTVTPQSSSTWQAMDPVVSVYGPDHAELGEVNALPEDRAEALTAPAAAAGRYHIRVQSVTGSRSPGTYSLGVTTSATSAVSPPGSNYSSWAVDTSPRSGASSVAADGAVTVTFARDVSDAGRNAVKLVHGRTRAEVAVTRSYDAGSRVLTLRPTGALDAFTPYQLRVRDSTSDVAYFVTGAAPPPPTTTTTTTTTSPAPSPAPAPAPAPTPSRSGYWMVDSGGHVYAFGDAGYFGGLNGARENVVDLEPTPSGNGYWLLTAVGEIFAYGDARSSGGPGGLPAAGEVVTSMSAHPGGAGYWVFTSRGRVLAFGGAPYKGDMAAVPLNGPVLDSVATPSGNGYYMVASDGGIFTFGDAAFRGSMGGHRLNAPVQSLVPDADNVGYWLVASDGGIFSFDATFRGSMGATRLNRPVTGMVRFGNGYLMVGEDGGIFTFSDKPFHGSLGNNPPPRPVVAVAAL
jgi:type VII secretion-associated serine protease mycosin